MLVGQNAVVAWRWLFHPEKGIQTSDPVDVIFKFLYICFS